MNKVIRGKRYDTESAESIGTVETALGRSTELYKKRTGEFFLAHWTSWDGENDRIQPINYEEAQEWCEENVDGDTFEKLFGPVEEGEKQTILMSLDKATIAKLKRIAVEKNISASELVEKMIKAMD